MNAISNKKDKEWLRLRQQKIAYQLRLRDRREEEKKNNQSPMVDQMTMKVLELTAYLLAPDQLCDFKAEMKMRLPKLTI